MEIESMLLWGILLASVGLGYFMYGRKQELLITKYCGLSLIVFPYFVPDVYWLVGIGAALVALPYFLGI